MVACCYHRYHHGYPLDTTEQPQVRGPEAGGVDRLAERAGVSRKYLDQILQGFQGKRDKNPRCVGDALAGKISLGLGLHDSWMDSPTRPLARAGDDELAGESAEVPAGRLLSFSHARLGGLVRDNVLISHPIPEARWAMVWSCAISPA